MLFPVLHSDCPFYAETQNPFPVGIDHILIYLLTHILLFSSHLAMLAIIHKLNYITVLSMSLDCPFFIVLSVFFNVYVLLLTIYTFLCTYTHVRYDFRIKTMFGSSLPPFMCALFMLFVFVCAQWCTACVVLCFSSYCVPYVASFSGLSFFFALRYSLTFIINIKIIQNHQKQCLD